MATSLQIPPHEVQRRLALDNPWWKAGHGIDPEEESWPRRAYFGQFSRLVRETAVRRAVVLIGPRRVGKTVMLKHLVDQLLQDGVIGTQVLFLSIDTPLYSGRSLESLVQMFTDLHRHPAGKPLWVLFDEVQYLKDWEVHLKSLVDSYPHIRFVASGSAAAALRMKSRESGAGRFTEFVLPPLTFAEYLLFAQREDALIRDSEPSATGAPTYLTNDIDALNTEFINYLNYGGFPEAVMNPVVRANPARFLRQDIVDKVLLKDLPAQGADAIGDPTQAHMVAIDARAPLYDGGICARVDCVSLGIVVNRDGERVVRMAGDHNAACQPGASTTPCSTTAPPSGCRLPRRTGRGRSTCRPSSAARCGPGSPSPASGSRSMCARRCACPARRDPPCSLTAR